MTQCEKILRHMEDYGSITSFEAMQEYGCMRLASRIADLRKSGIPIAKETIVVINRYGDPVSVAKYYLSKDVIA